MGSFWRVDLDQQMFAIADQRPFIWRYLLLNDYMRAGNKVEEYLEVMRSPGVPALKHLTGRFPRAEDAETIVNNLFRKYTGFAVAELRRLVINLFNILAHLKSMLNQADMDSDKVCKPEVIVAMCMAFIRAFNKQQVPEIPKDSTGAIKAVIAFFENSQNFGEVPSGHEVQTLQNNLFQLSRGNSLETKNPCEIMQTLFRASLKLLLPKYSDKDFIVGGLPEDMCSAQQCCRIPFESNAIQSRRVDKSFKQIEGFNIMAPDFSIADITPDRPTAILQKARRDFFLLLRCSAYFNVDVNTGRMALPMNSDGWQNAFFDHNLFYMVPAFNLVRMKAILEAVKQHSQGADLPIVVGEQRGRLGNLYVLDLPAEPMDVEEKVDFKPTKPAKSAKSVHWEDVGGAGVETQTTIPPYKKQGDTSQGVILMIVAAALVAVTVLR